MRLTAAAGLALLAWCATARAETRFHGVWGTARQCAGDLVQPGGTLRAAPVQITEGWLKQGRTWCALSWFPAQPRAGGLFAGATALCGEDTQRRHTLGLAYGTAHGTETLTLVWNDSLVNGPLRRCGPG
jgi:hypothetical protein